MIIRSDQCNKQITAGICEITKGLTTFFLMKVSEAAGRLKVIHRSIQYRNCMTHQALVFPSNKAVLRYQGFTELG